jgi:hypothetical protein
MLYSHSSLHTAKHVAFKGAGITSNILISNSRATERSESEENGGEPVPKRAKLDIGLICC